MSMILEGILTTIDPTVDAKGRLHTAAMGVLVPDDAIDVQTGRLAGFRLRPYSSSITFRNLVALPEGVFHLTDDVLLLARILVGETVAPDTRAATSVVGGILSESCLAYEFRGSFAEGSPGSSAHDVASLTPTAAPARAEFEATVTAFHSQRPFIGFNRARNAVLETAILVSRIGILPLAEIRSQVAALAVTVEKTAGSREREAFAILRARVDAAT